MEICDKLQALTVLTLGTHRIKGWRGGLQRLCENSEGHENLLVGESKHDSSIGQHIA